MWSEDVLPKAKELSEQYGNLTPRELTIVAGGVLDIALADMIALRLKHQLKLAERFVGLTGEANAPAGNFASRIDLAVLLGIILLEDGEVFHCIRSLRNHFAHTVFASVTSEQGASLVWKLHQAWEKRREIDAKVVGITRLRVPEAVLRDAVMKGELSLSHILLPILIMYHIDLQNFHRDMEPVEPPTYHLRGRTMLRDMLEIEQTISRLALQRVLRGLKIGEP